MPIVVHYFGQIRRAVAADEEVVDLRGGTVADLARRLAERHPAAAHLFLDDAGQPKRSLLFFVDDVPLAAEGRLTENAAITVLTPMAGGSIGLISLGETDSSRGAR